ncbi:unnamed protein product, partial [Amoebophrya sp. A25]
LLDPRRQRGRKPEARTSERARPASIVGENQEPGPCYLAPSSTTSQQHEKIS